MKNIIIAFVVVGIILVAASYMRTESESGTENQVENVVRDTVSDVAPPVPTASSTQAERIEYVRYMTSVAVVGTELDVSDCSTVKPSVLEIPIDDTLSLVNSSNEAVFIQIPAFGGTSVPPKGQATIRVDVVPSPGLWPVTCGTTERAALLHVR